jgi:phosphomannomutase
MSKPLSLKIGPSGVRGVVGETLTPQLVVSYAAAFGNYSGGGPVLIGTDTRSSAEMVKQAAIAGLLSVGSEPVDVGIVPVPALMLHVREAKARGGLSISASHHPVEWNALKFIGPDGVVLRANQAAELTDLYHQGVFSRVSADAIAVARTDPSTLARHRAAVLAAVDVEAIRRRHFRVAVDCCNGAASSATPAFLEALGCEVIALHVAAGAPFPRDPEPAPQNIGVLCEAVRAHAADIGFAQDADADRLAIVDEQGRALGEDCTLALAVDHWLRRRPGTVVVNVATSRMIDDLAARYGARVVRTRVGESHVVEKMIDVGAEIGGEGNGGVILRPVNACRDSFVGMALVLEALAGEEAPVSVRRSRLPAYAMVQESLLCPAREIAPALRLLRRIHAEQVVDVTDGVKVSWSDRWLLVRPSNTEPILRITAEAASLEDARALVNGVLEILSPAGSR